MRELDKRSARERVWGRVGSGVCWMNEGIVGEL